MKENKEKLEEQHLTDVSGGVDCPYCGKDVSDLGYHVMTHHGNENLDDVDWDKYGKHWHF